jgi:class 3 adenylate cyclase
MGEPDGKGGHDRPPASGVRIQLAHETAMRLGALRIEPALRTVAHDDGREEVVEPRVMQVLVALARASGAIITRDDLLASCWHGVVVGEDAISRVMGRLRRLADGIGAGQFKLETVTKVGYRLVPLVPGRETASPAATLTPARGLPDPSQAALHGERRYIYAMFTDLQGFGDLTRGLPPEVVASVLNAYLDRVSRTVVEHGGTIDKFIGDAMVAFWGAPVARPDDGERAARAAIAMWRVEAGLRATPTANHAPLGPTRVGLHRGDAIVGAFGGEGRNSYSALGEAMNTASGLETANRALNTMILISREAMPSSMAGVFRAMGRISLPRRAEPVEVFEAAPDFPAEACARLNAAYARFDAGELVALGEIATLAAEHPEDVALHSLVVRLERAGPGGVARLS